MEEIKEVDNKATSDEATAYSIGILFAAHSTAPDPPRVKLPCQLMPNCRTENPAITASQVISFLIENPSAMKRVKAEIDANLKKTKIESITVTQLQNDFPLLLAAVWETLRLCSHSLGSVRIVKETPFVFSDSKGQQFTLPEGTLVASSPLSLSLDGNMFQDARNFDLDRLLPPRSENSKHTIALTPFSHGTHGCPGRPFALLMVQYCVLSILTKYDLEAKLPLPELDFHKATVAQRSKPVTIDWTVKSN
jgi:cytochrome P450